jgi:hypothetical protein
MDLCETPIEIVNDALRELTEEEATALDWSIRSDASIDDEDICRWSDGSDESLDASDEDLYDDD